MRILREKSTRKTLSFYEIHSGIEAPYNILCDGNFIVAIFRYHVPLLERLNSLLQGDKFKLYTTISVKKEIGALVKQSSSSSSISQEQNQIFKSAQKFIKQKCRVVSKIPSITEDEMRKDYYSEKLESLKNNQVSLDLFALCTESDSKRYFIATQDEDLRSILRCAKDSSVHVPIIYLNKVMVMLESPSSSSQQLVLKQEDKKLGRDRMLKQEKEILTRIKSKNEKQEKEKRLKNLKEELVECGAFYHAGGKKKKKAKGPNPLSCKKKKRKAEDMEKTKEGSVNDENKKKRRRKKKKTDTDE